MKRIITGLILGLFVFFFVFFTSYALFQIILASILGFSVYELFKIIPRGMHKADLWRICKLYKNAGIYADVDLVPYININELDKNITFYSCIASTGDHIFQAFISHFSKPNHPLLLVLIISFGLRIRI